jgi:hypothetical protein
MRAAELRDMAQAGLEAVASANAIEKVHRAAVALEWLEPLSPGLVQSKPGAAGLGVPFLP